MWSIARNLLSKNSSVSSGSTSFAGKDVDSRSKRVQEYWLALRDLYISLMEIPDSAKNSERSVVRISKAKALIFFSELLDALRIFLKSCSWVTRFNLILEPAGMERNPASIFVTR